jgi:hypothetical protein
MSDDLIALGLRRPVFYAALFDSAGNRHSEWTPANPDGSLSIRIPQDGPTVVRLSYADSPDGPVEHFTDYKAVRGGDAIGNGAVRILPA